MIKSLCCAPGEKINPTVLSALQTANEAAKKTGFAKYLEDVAKIFNLDPPTPLTIPEKFYFGGYIEGEGSINVSAKKLKTAKFGLIVDPEFSITQHVNGIANLYAALAHFKTGRIRHKTSSNATFVFIIDNRIALKEKIVPFMREFTVMTASQAKKERLDKFARILDLLEDGKHQDVESLKNQILPIWDDMRMQKGQSNQVFKDLQEAQDYVAQFKTKS